MAAGGIYDHLEAVSSLQHDARCRCRTSKMFTTTSAVGCYLSGGHVSCLAPWPRNARLRVARHDRSGGWFYSSEDADSEGEEGKFYVWTPSEIQAILGRAGSDVLRDLRRDRGGQLRRQEHSSRARLLEETVRLLYREPAELAAELVRSRELLARARRRPDATTRSRSVERPDDRRMARASAALGELAMRRRRPRARFLLIGLSATVLAARLQRRSPRGWVFDDYASLAHALVTLYETRFEERWIDEAVRLADVILRDFADEREGGFFFTSSEHAVPTPGRKTCSTVPCPAAVWPRWSFCGWETLWAG